jgi:solute carrier family 6 amino acid transporter-like protein 5/7/9/14
MPIFKGIGWAMIIMVGMLAIYYNMLIAWTMYFFSASFTLNDLPWSSCGKASN